MRCDEILNIQAMGLKKRMDHIHCHKATVGLSGGLDSTLALLVIARAFDLSRADRKDIHCITHAHALEPQTELIRMPAN